jgi:phospholipase/carboxylesterase
MAETAQLHQGQQVLAAGEPLDKAKAAMIMIHGRGSSADNIIGLSADLDQPGFAFLAPQANGNTWYPYPFMQPIESNEPYLSSALSVITDLLNHLDASGIPAERTMILGFSQGACLTLEFTARNARRYGAAVGLSGGLIGPDGTPRNYPGSLDAVFLGCSDVDFHIPKERVTESAEILRKLGGDVTTRLYPQMGHTINQDEIDFVKGMMAALVK